jgi:hypothetical protein
VDKAVDKRPLQWISRRFIFREEFSRMNVCGYVAAEKISITCRVRGARRIFLADGARGTVRLVFNAD